MEGSTPSNHEENEINEEEEEEKRKRKKRKKHKHKKDKNSESESDDEQQKKEEKKNQLLLKDLIAEHFVLLHLIGQGAFGQIYISYNMRDNIAVSIKKEIKKAQKIPQLKTESKVYQALLNINSEDVSGAKQFNQDEVQGVPKFYGVGELQDSYYLIMEFLGPNLLELFEYCGCHKFTISTVCLLALQMLNRIENLHKHYYLHRDIKPENFLIGMQEKANIIYLIDFGLSKRYKNPKTHQHIPYREGRSLTGTARYVSINTHLGIEQSRRDDLESIGYVLVYFLKGVLPWQGLKNGNRYTRIMEKKLQIPTEILCYGLPEEIIFYLNYCKSLRYEDRPDYDYLRGLFIKLLGTCNVIYGLTKEMLKFDWCFEDPMGSIWQIYNKKKQGGGGSNLNSSFGKEKEKSDDVSDEKEKAPNVIKKKKPGVSLLKKQLSNIDEVNDLITNENNPNYERSDSSESGSDDSKNKEQKKEIVDKNLIKEESESKIASESEETVRESFQPVPQDLEEGKLNDQLKTIFFTQAQSERIDTYITQLMEPQKTIVEVGDKDKDKEKDNNNNNNNDGGDILQFETEKNEENEENEKANNSINNNQNNNVNNNENNNGNNNNNNNKELIDSSDKSKSKGKDSNSGKKNDSKVSSRRSERKKDEVQLSKMDIEKGSNDESGRLKVSLRNSKNYTTDMENKVNNLKNKGEYLKFNEIEVNDKIEEEDKEHSNDEKDEKEENNANEKKVSYKSKKTNESKKKNVGDENNENNNNNINNENNNNNNNEENNSQNENEDRDSSKKDDNQKEKKDIDKIKTSAQKQNTKDKDKDNTIPTIEEKPKNKNDNNQKKVKRDDTSYISFKTTKNKENNNKKDKDAKSYGTSYLHETPGNETPSGTPNGNVMKVSKEELIKISTEPVANYYTIIKDLGHGSYGQVKKVKHKKLNEIRAMKITNKKSNSSKYEIEILRKISHPNITNIFEIFADSKKYYVIMEYLEGGELFDAITSIGSFTEESACQVMKQLLSAIFYLHSNCIVHRDLKPENIMLLQKPENGNYHIKLIDFGTAKIFKPGKKMNKFIGTSYYIAPEVLKERYDEKCDVWSCGIILYILLCGYPPFNGNTNVEIFHAIQNQNPLFAGEEWDDITNEAKELIKLMLRKNPNERWDAAQCLKHKWFKILEDSEKSKNAQKNFKQIQINAINHMAQFVNENRFKQAVLQFISTQFNIQKEEGDLRELFKSMDISGTGQLSKDEFCNKLMELYGENDGKNIASNIFNNLDLDGSGKISYDEFLSAMISSKKVVTEERLEKAFKLFDKDNSGKLSVKEIKAVFGGTEEQWKNVINEIDLNNDGEVDFAEFKIMMENMDKNKIIEKKKKTETVNTYKEVSED